MADEDILSKLRQMLGTAGSGPLEIPPQQEGESLVDYAMRVSDGTWGTPVAGSLRPVGRVGEALRGEMGPNGKPLRVLTERLKRHRALADDLTPPEGPKPPGWFESRHQDPGIAEAIRKLLGQ